MTIKNLKYYVSDHLFSFVFFDVEAYLAILH